MTASAENAPDRLDHVAALTTDLCNAVLHTHLAGQSVPDEQIEALVKAAMLFRDAQRPWPFILEQVLEQLSREVDGDEASEPTGESSLHVEQSGDEEFRVAREA